MKGFLVCDSCKSCFPSKIVPTISPCGTCSCSRFEVYVFCTKCQGEGVVFCSPDLKNGNCYIWNESYHLGNCDEPCYMQCDECNGEKCFFRGYIESNVGKSFKVNTDLTKEWIKELNDNNITETRKLKSNVVSSETNFEYSNSSSIKATKKNNKDKPTSENEDPEDDLKNYNNIRIEIQNSPTLFINTNCCMKTISLITAIFLFLYGILTLPIPVLGWINILITWLLAYAAIKESSRGTCFVFIFVIVVILVVSLVFVIVVGLITSLVCFSKR